MSLVVDTQQKSVGDVGMMRRSLNTSELPEIGAHLSAKVGDLSSGFTAVSGPGPAMPGCPSSFGLVPAIDTASFQPRASLPSD